MDREQFPLWRHAMQTVADDTSAYLWNDASLHPVPACLVPYLEEYAPEGGFNVLHLTVSNRKGPPGTFAVMYPKGLVARDAVLHCMEYDGRCRYHIRVFADIPSLQRIIKNRFAFCKNKQAFAMVTSRPTELPFEVTFIGVNQRTGTVDRELFEYEGLDTAWQLLMSLFVDMSDATRLEVIVRNMREIKDIPVYTDDNLEEHKYLC